jgi:uncharacterized protein
MNETIRLLIILLFNLLMEVTMATKRGFAAMDPERQREIASMGGRHAHAIGKAHKYTTETGRVAGKIGGLRPRGKKK